MGSNSFGNLFKITTWGESHGKAIGVVIDGCPAGLELSDLDIHEELKKRRPGQSAHTSPRKEADLSEILSGVFEGKTTGAPISIIIYNQDVQSKGYETIKELYRPGHAHFTYQNKYGIFDHRGGGRASARETACRVAAGAVAKKLLRHFDIECRGYLSEMGEVKLSECADFQHHSSIFCPHAETEQQMLAVLEKAKTSGDSLGGVVAVETSHLPIGLGDPVYEKLEANLAKAMLSLPATKGFEIGQGFGAASMHGSQHNDGFTLNEQGIAIPASNHAGGTLGGISTGMPLVFRVAFKPTSSIKHSQSTVDIHGNQKSFTLPEDARHDPCVAIRAVPVVEAMTALVLADALLLHRSSRL
jgi:chorismate synthase